MESLPLELLENVLSCLSDFQDHEVSSFSPVSHYISAPFPDVRPFWQRNLLVKASPTLPEIVANAPDST